MMMAMMTLNVNSISQCDCSLQYYRQTNGRTSCNMRVSCQKHATDLQRYIENQWRIKMSNVYNEINDNI